MTNTAVALYSPMLRCPELDVDGFKIYRATDTKRLYYLAGYDNYDEPIYLPVPMGDAPRTLSPLTKFGMWLAAGTIGVALIFGASKSTSPPKNARAMTTITQQQTSSNQKKQSAVPQTKEAFLMPDNCTSQDQQQLVHVAWNDALKYGVDPRIFVKQINQESGFNRYAQSPVGALGVAQFMPATATAWGVTDPYNPTMALDGAARLMRSNLNYYGYSAEGYAKALAAYNAGGAAVNRAVALGGANWLNYLPAETQAYVIAIEY